MHFLFFLFMSNVWVSLGACTVIMITILKLATKQSLVLNSKKLSRSASDLSLKAVTFRDKRMAEYDRDPRHVVYLDIETLQEEVLNIRETRENKTRLDSWV